MEEKKRVLMVAGEASGDLHGANLVKSLKSLNPQVQFYGIGGEELRKEGVEIAFDSSELAVVGITEVFSKLFLISRAFRHLKKWLRKKKPDLVILIDYPDFNLRLARVASRMQIPVLYYISPQVWAWRKNRVKKIARLVDKMAVIFSFETHLYEKEKVDVRWVGHPLLDVVRPKLSKKEARERFGLEKDRVTIGLLPGSRKGELEILLPEMLKAAKILAKRLEKVDFVLPAALTLDARQINDIIKREGGIEVKVIRNHMYDVLNVSHLVIVASGTATLEAAIMETPMVILYKVSFLTYFIGRFLIKIKDIGLVNIVAGKRVVPELIQKKSSPEKISETALKVLEEPESILRLKQELAEIKKKLGKPGAAKRVARIAREMM